jgi:hypothetical protein
MRWDYKHTRDGDLDLSSGDLQMVEPTEQHQRDLLLAAQGDFKEYPVIGVGSMNYLHDTEPTGYLRAVRREFTRDGMNVRELYMRQEELFIDADYEDNKS